MRAAARARELGEYIVRDPAMHDGRPTIRGSRVEVADIVRYLRAGYSPARIARALPTLALAQVHAALAYYYEHQAEIDSDMREADAYVAAKMRNARGVRSHRSRPTR